MHSPPINPSSEAAAAAFKAEWQDKAASAVLETSTRVQHIFGPVTHQRGSVGAGCSSFQHFEANGGRYDKDT